MSRRGIAVGVLLFASFMDLVDATIVNVALPTMRSDLDASPAQLEWIVGGYTLALAVLLVTGGRLGDVLGRRTVFVIGVVGFTLASLGAAVAGDADLLVVARVVQGGFAAMMVPQLLSTIQVMYEPKERAAIFGVVGAVMGTAAVIGPLLGGWLVTSDIAGLGWRTIFLINVPIGVVLAAMAIRLVPDTRAERARGIDVAGLVLATSALLLLVYPLVEGRQLGWPTWVWAMFAASAVVMALFVVVERRVERRDGSSLLPMHLFADRGYSAGLVAQATFQAAMVGLVLVLTIYVQTGLGFSAIDAGLMLVPFSLGAFVGTGISAPFGTRIGKAIPFLGALFQAGGTIWLAQLISDQGDDLGRWSVALPLGVAGVGLGLLVVPLIDIALATVPLRDAGAASGAYSTIQQVGAALGVAIIGAVFFDVVDERFTPVALRDGVGAASWWVAGGYLVCAAATLLLPDRRAVQQHTAEQDAIGITV
jgi:EmrB/QacA subfamily drug resistance transporter